MAMNAGTLNVENDTMARAIYDAMNSILGPAANLEADGNLRRICAAIAQGVVEHITEHAEANTDTGEIT